MRKIESINEETIMVNSEGFINSFKVSWNYIDEIKTWPREIEITIKKEGEKYKITPVDWFKNYVFADRIF